MSQLFMLLLLKCFSGMLYLLTTSNIFVCVCTVHVARRLWLVSIGLVTCCMMCLQIKFLEMIEFLVFGLNFIPCKELITISIIIKTNQ